MSRVDRKRHPAFLPTLLQSGSPVCYKTPAGGAKVEQKLYPERNCCAKINPVP
jgi:hypothetical protein